MLFFYNNCNICLYLSLVNLFSCIYVYIYWFNLILHINLWIYFISSEQENDEVARKQLAGVDEGEALKKLLDSEDEDENEDKDKDDKEKDEKDENKDEKDKKKKKKKKDKKDKKADSKFINLNKVLF